MFALAFTVLLIHSVNSLAFENLPGVYQLTEPVEHGEGPIWDERTGLLYFVSIREGKILSYDPKTEATIFIELPGSVSPVVTTLNDANTFLVGLNRSLVSVTWNGRHAKKEWDVLSTVSEDFSDSRFNDGKVDSQGRLWFGTMGYEDSNGVKPNQGFLYRFSKDKLDNPDVVLFNVAVSNGMAWNKANDKFYYIDSPTYKIMEYSYNGDISNPRVAFDCLSAIGAEAIPDGMTIDKDDNLWVALHGAGSVIQIDPIAGKLLRKIAIPAEFVTSVAWGGDEYDILFVTTSRVNLDASGRRKQPACGSLFGITGLGTCGFASFKANV